MLPDRPTAARLALNRTTFGARDTDVAALERMGWDAWVDDQLSPPAGDDPQLAQFIDSQRLHYNYPEMTFGRKSWPALEEDRPLNYLKASVEQLYQLAKGPVGNYTFGEQGWPRLELNSAIFIRNAHSRFQLREVMVDFWLNHFSMSWQKSAYVATSLVSFDRDVVRPNAFGNFRTLLEAVARSPAMLVYLDNADSTAALPNENYARELMELHTMGESAYLGKVPAGPDSSSRGFTDLDILNAGRALSGWTIERTQIPGREESGRFTYYEGQHNRQAGVCLGFDLSKLQGEAQGRKVLDLVAYHPATPRFICTKICRRLFGDAPPEAVILRAVDAWNRHRESAAQIAHVLRAILLDGPEISTEPATKVRRPYERVMALWRATDAVVNADLYWGMFLGDLNDSPFVWPTPNGRPDVNSFWLNTFVNVTTWQYLRGAFDQASIKTSLRDQMPDEARASIVQTVDYWVGRIIGYALAPEAMQALYRYAGWGAAYPFPGQAWDPDEATLRNLVCAISVAPEFALR